MKPRPIDTARHRKDRKRYLDRHPLCERCEKRGKVEAATILHHKDRNQENRSWDNYEALCNDCHEIEHGRKGAGCDVDGMPLDPRHPWARKDER